MLGALLCLVLILGWVFVIGVVVGVAKKPDYEQDDEFLEIMADMEEKHKKDLKDLASGLNGTFTAKLNDFKSNVGNALAGLKTNDTQLVARIGEIKKYFDLENYTKVEMSDTQWIKQESGLREIPATLTPKKK